MTKRVFLLALVGAALATPLACQTGASLPELYLGRWYYVGTSGGIAGSSFGEPDGTFIVITEANELQSYDAAGTLLGTEGFHPSLGRSIFSTSDEWILDADAALPRVIRISADGETMALSENVYDGFSSAYRRTR